MLQITTNITETVTASNVVTVFYRIVAMAEEVSCLKARLMEKEKEIVALKNKLALEKVGL